MTFNNEQDKEIKLSLEQDVTCGLDLLASFSEVNRRLTCKLNISAFIIGLYEIDLIDNKGKMTEFAKDSKFAIACENEEKFTHSGIMYIVDNIER